MDPESQVQPGFVRRLMYVASFPIRLSYGVLAVAIASAFLSIILLSGCSGESSIITARAAEPSESVLPSQGHIQDFALTDQYGNRVALSDFQGRTVLLSFFYSVCPDFCPSMNYDLKRINDTLTSTDREKVTLLSVSFDPIVDSPSTLKQYAASHGFDAANWYFLSGSGLEINRVLAASGVAAEETPAEEHLHGDGATHHHPRGFNHMAQALLIDQRGEVRKAYLGVSQDGEIFSVELLTGDIHNLLSERE